MISEVISLFFILHDSHTLVDNIKPIAKYENIIITSFDAYVECRIYKELELSHNNCENSDLYLYAFLYATRQKFKFFAGFENEISNLILKKTIPKIDHKKFIDLGIDEEKLQIRAISIYAFSKRIQSIFGVTFDEFLDLSQRYVREKRGLKVGGKESEEIWNKAEKKVFAGMLNMITSGIEFIQ